MDIENTMRFILDMQGKHEAAIQRHNEEIAEIRRLTAENSRQIAANTTRIGQLVDVGLSLTHNIEQGFQEMREGFRGIREIQVATDYKLNALIDTVDKLVRHNGHKRHQSFRILNGGPG